MSDEFDAVVKLLETELRVIRSILTWQTVVLVGIAVALGVPLASSVA